MNKHEFLKRFQLHSLQQSRHKYQYPKEVRQAAVLIPLVATDNGLNVLLTKRATHLKHHAGQVSFPGGKAEPTDESLIATALREAEEEIGLRAEHVDIVGQLHLYQTISGFVITPIIGIVDFLPPLHKDKNEVSEIFQVPLTHFLNTDNLHAISTYVKGSFVDIHFTPYNNHRIWGATSAMLVDLIHHIR